MKTFIKKSLIILIITFISGFIYSLAEADDYIEYANNEDSSFYIKESSIQYIDENDNKIIVFDAAVRYNPGAAAKSLGVKNKNVKALEIRYALSCTNYRFITIFVNVYDKNGKIVDREGQSKGYSIKPGSYMDIAYLKLCRTEKYEM